MNTCIQNFKDCCTIFSVETEARIHSRSLVSLPDFKRRQLRQDMYARWNPGSNLGLQLSSDCSWWFADKRSNSNSALTKKLRKYIFSGRHFGATCKVILTNCLSNHRGSMVVLDLPPPTSHAIPCVQCLSTSIVLVPAFPQLDHPSTDLPVFSLNCTFSLGLHLFLLFLTF